VPERLKEPVEIDLRFAFFVAGDVLAHILDKLGQLRFLYFVHAQDPMKCVSRSDEDDTAFMWRLRAAGILGGSRIMSGKIRRRCAFVVTKAQRGGLWGETLRACIRVAGSLEIEERCGSEM